MKTLLKAVPCVLKDLDSEPKILCFFEFPHVELFQIPKGTVEENEDLETAVLRELVEETGIEKAQINNKIGVLERICPGGRAQELKDEKQIWHLYHVQASKELETTWQHIGTGNGIDNGIKVQCFWHKLSDENLENYNEIFIRSFELVKEYLKK